MTKPSTQPETVMIDSLDAFVRALTHWHTHKVQVLKHMQSIPEGSEVTRSTGSDSPEEQIKLSGDMLKGFILGLELALDELGELPFEAEISFTDPNAAITDPAAVRH